MLRSARRLGIASAGAFLLPAAGALSLILAWELLIPWLGVPRYVIPTPGQVIRRLLIDPGLVLRNLVPTAIESLSGFALGNVLAVLTATLFVCDKRVERAYFPVILFMNTIPVLALAPVMVLIFGIGLLAKSVTAAIICFFPTLVNVVRGLEAIGSTERELMHVLSASALETFLRVRIPRAVPSLFTALRISSTTCVVGAIVGEWIGANRGIGALIIQSTFSYRADLLYLAIIMSSSLAVLIFGLVVVVEAGFRRYL